MPPSRKPIIWTGSLARHEDDWQIGCRAFPWIYLIRDTDAPDPDA